jgi:hypothetical protein
MTLPLAGGTVRRLYFMYLSFSEDFFRKTAAGKERVRIKR